MLQLRSGPFLGRRFFGGFRKVSGLRASVELEVVAEEALALTRDARDRESFRGVSEDSRGIETHC